MGIKIELPDNGQRFMQLGIEHKEKREFETAFELFEKSFELEATQMAQAEMIDCLLQIDTSESLERAEKDVLENQRIILQNESGVALFLHVLMKTHNFYRIKAFILDPALPLPAETLQAYFEQLVSGEAVYKLSSKNKIEETKKALFYLGDKPIKEQQHLIELGEHLPTDIFVECLLLLVKNPFLNQLTRVDLFDKLVHLNVDQEIECLDYQSKTHSINPCHAQTIVRDQTTLLIEQILKEKISETDITMQQMIIEEAHLQSLFLYPFTKSVIGEVNNWVKGYLKTYQLLPETELDEEKIKKAQKLQAVIREKLLESVQF